MVLKNIELYTKYQLALFFINQDISCIKISQLSGSWNHLKSLLSGIVHSLFEFAEYFAVPVI